MQNNVSSQLHQFYDSYVQVQNEKEKTRDSLSQVAETGLQSVAAKYEGKLEKLTADVKWDRLMKHKIVALLFFDGIPSVVGEKHSITSFILQFGYGSTTFASLAWQEVVQELMNDPRLTPESKMALSHWLTSEQSTLPFEMIFDGWRSQGETLSYVSGEKRPLFYEDVSKEPSGESPKPEELKIVSASAASRITHLKPGESFPLLGGYLTHETRLDVECISDSEWIVRHYDSATGKSFEIPVRSAKGRELLHSPAYWAEFFQHKFSSDNIKATVNHLKKLGKKTDLDPDHVKSRQQTNSCSGHCIEAQFKDRLIACHSEKAAGVEQYKVFKALAAKAALKLYEKEVDKEFIQLMQFVDLKRSNYLDWSEMGKDPRAIKKLEGAYAAALDLLGLSKVDVEDETAFAGINKLDKRLERALLKATPERFHQLKPQLEELFKHLPLPPCLKFYDKLGEVASSLLSTIQSAQNTSGARVEGDLKAFSGAYLPKSWQGIFQSKVSMASIISLAETIYKATGTIPEALLEDLFSKLPVELDQVLGLLKKYSAQGSSVFVSKLAKCYLKSLPMPPLEKIILQTLSDPKNFPQIFEDNKAPLTDDLKKKISLALKNEKGAHDLGIEQQMKKTAEAFDFLCSILAASGEETSIYQIKEYMYSLAA